MAVSCVSQGSFAVDVVVEGHSLRADEPRELGGTDTGPSPFGLLLAAVGSCTAITIVDAARERGLALNQVVVRVKHRQNVITRHPGDPNLSMTAIRREIEIEGDVTPEERAWLLRLS